jgi:hypothetical protein
MPRRTRRQMVGNQEDMERVVRERQYAALVIELHRLLSIPHHRMLDCHAIVTETSSMGCHVRVTMQANH